MTFPVKYERGGNLPSQSPAGDELLAGDEVGWDPASFRDPSGRVFTVQGRVFRAIRSSWAEAWKEFSSSPLFQELQQEGLLIKTIPAAGSLQFPASLTEGSCAVVEHERIPFVSYPYEWSFGMLKDAALLHLDLLERTLPYDFICKDASAYNVQFVGSKPVFVDILSITRHALGEPWLGYHQFCKMFLYPLMLEAYKQIPFQSWLRSELEGVDPVLFSRVMGARDLLRPGVFTHVRLQAWLQKRLAASRDSVRRRIKISRLPKAAIVRNLRGLRRLLHRLTPRSDSAWMDYVRTRSYSDLAMKQKEGFVRKTLAGQQWRFVWDLGCNTGDFSRLAADHADYVVALDSDPLCVEWLYQGLKQEGRRNILPLVMNLANLSPNQGWAGRERLSLAARGKPDLALCLALIHHLTINCNVPIPAFLSWLAELGTSVIIEFVSKEDPMVRQLLLNKDDTYEDYNRPGFEQYLNQFFNVRDTSAIAGGTRFLYFAVPLSKS